MTIIDQLCDEIAKEIDEKAFEFLNQNGYKIEKPYTIEKALAIKEQLKRDNKVLKHKVVVDKIIFDGDNYQVINKVQFELEELSE